MFLDPFLCNFVRTKTSDKIFFINRQNCIIGASGDGKKVNIYQFDIL